MNMQTFKTKLIVDACLMHYCELCAYLYLNSPLHSGLTVFHLASWYPPLNCAGYILDFSLCASSLLLLLASNHLNGTPASVLLNLLISRLSSLIRTKVDTKRQCWLVGFVVFVGEDADSAWLEHEWEAGVHWETDPAFCECAKTMSQLVMCLKNKSKKCWESFGWCHAGQLTSVRGQ